MYNPTIKLRLTSEQKREVAVKMIKCSLNKKFKVADILNNLTKDSEMAKLIREEEQKALKANEGWFVVG